MPTANQFLLRPPNLLSLTALVIGAFAFTYELSRTIVVRRAVYAQVTTTPFVLVRDTYNFDKNPSGDLLERSTVARRSDGSTAEIFSVGPLTSGLTAGKISFLDGKKLFLFDVLRAKSTYSFAPKEEVMMLKYRLLNSSGTCVIGRNEFLQGEDSILGQHISVTQWRNAQGRYTAWKATALGCEVLRYRTELIDSTGSYKLKTELRPASLVLGDPPPAFFAAGEGYAEFLPSAVAHQFADKSNIVLTPEQAAALAQSDRAYQRHRQH